MNVSMNHDWARFKALGIARLGRPGFAAWLDHAAFVMRLEAAREEANAAYRANQQRAGFRLVGGSPEEALHGEIG